MKLIPLESSHIITIAYHAVETGYEAGDTKFYLQFKNGAWYRYTSNGAASVDSDVVIAATVALIAFNKSPGTAFNSLTSGLNYVKLTDSEVDEEIFECVV